MNRVSSLKQTWLYVSSEFLWDISHSKNRWKTVRVPRLKRKDESTSVPSCADSMFSPPLEDAAVLLIWHQGAPTRRIQTGTHLHVLPVSTGGRGFVLVLLLLLLLSNVCLHFSCNELCNFTSDRHNVNCGEPRRRRRPGGRAESNQKKDFSVQVRF